MPTHTAKPRWEAFLSHASEEDSLATGIGEHLASHQVAVWLDHQDLRRQGLLLAALQDAIEHSRHLVLLWSKASARSRYVTSEWNFAWNRNRSIIPCRVDRTPLPMGLAGMLYCDFRSSFDEGIGQLDQVLTRSTGAKPVPTVQPVQRTVERKDIGSARQAVDRIAAQQDEILRALDRGDAGMAARLQAQLGPVVDAALRKYPKDADVNSLAGYHLKNAYLLKHGRAFQAGQSPADPLLERSEARFWAALQYRPNDASALNGIGNVLWLRGELDAAEFYIQHSIARARAEGFAYPFAEDDLRHLRMQRAARAKMARHRTRA